MISKILVANRGEIACRVIRTAQRMGIATVAVYSEADARAPHVLMADEAVLLGPAPAAQSYLLADRIIAACKQTGANAVHPGYGFLSERAEFAQACIDNDILFIGPPPAAIAAMGDKIESKKIAQKSGVNIVPGFVGAIEGIDHAQLIASEIGYPVMMKASAGGGGKGMRLAWSEAELCEGFPAVQREARASFGDDRLLIEKFIEQPRHIEIQILGDQHGNLVHLGERECSIQRRHQKVVEEAPSPFVTPDMRAGMGAQAVALARSVGYFSAGTVEFIVSGADKSGQGFYFLEMNTRLQVEHPVTELVTGLDLVEQMIRVANGEKLGFSQEDVRLDGWAMETRVYAEDPYRGFLPSTGRLVRYMRPHAIVPLPLAGGARGGPFDGEVEEDPHPSKESRDSFEPLPQAGEGVTRVDDGVAEGGEVSMFYDPMIAKLVTHGSTRAAAIDLQIDALDRFEIAGPHHNIDFLSALMQHERFRNGTITTGFISEEYPDGFNGAPASPELRRRIAAIAAFVSMAQADCARRVDGQLGRRLPPPTDWQVRVAGVDHDVAINGDDVIVDGLPLVMALDYTPGDRLIEAEFGEDGAEETLAVQIAPIRMGWRLTTRGAAHQVRVIPAHVAAYAPHMIERTPPDLSRFLMSPMPGRLVALHVGEGDRVEAGQSLAVVEAMKMENILRAVRAGTVSRVSAAAGDTLALDQMILEMD